MNYKSFNLGDWIGHISGVIEDETTLDGNEMRDLIEFLSTLKQESMLDKIRAEIMQLDYDTDYVDYDYNDMVQTKTIHTICREEVLHIIDKYKTGEETTHES